MNKPVLLGIADLICSGLPLSFSLGFFAALPFIEGSGRDLDYMGNLARFTAQFFPRDWSILDRTLSGLFETVQIPWFPPSSPSFFPSLSP